jgi:hypothetical protein
VELESPWHARACASQVGRQRDRMSAGPRLAGGPYRAHCVSKVTKESGVCMREHVHIASRRRDERLAMIRKLTLWISGGAAAASLALGVAFANAVPGHAVSTPTTTGSGASSTSGTSPGGSAKSTNSAGASSGSSQPGQNQSRLSQPRQQPAHTTGPPAVTSGGS